MFTDSAPYFIAIYENIHNVMLIFARIAGFIYLIPIFKSTNVPTRVKAGFCFAVAICIFSSGVAVVSAEPRNVMQFVIIIAKELITGLILGFVVNMFFAVFHFAGQMMDYSIGFSMANVLDPASGMQVPITGKLIDQIMAILLLVTGGFHVLLATFFESYKMIPIGMANLAMDQGFMEYLITLSASYLSLGIRIASPIVGTILVIDVALGILVKATPQMNVFVVGMPIKLLVGLVILFFVCPYLLEVYHEVFSLIYDAITTIIGGMGYQ